MRSWLDDIIRDRDEAEEKIKVLEEKINRIEKLFGEIDEDDTRHYLARQILNILEE